MLAGNNLPELYCDVNNGRSRICGAFPDGSQWATSAAVVPLPGVWTLTLDVALGPSDAYATSASYRVW
jgi:hypothetical protein